jgi:hypothetical protein
MKKLLALLFTFAVAFSLVMPVFAQEAAAQETTKTEKTKKTKAAKTKKTKKTEKTPTTTAPPS